MLPTHAQTDSSGATGAISERLANGWEYFRGSLGSVWDVWRTDMPREHVQFKNFPLQNHDSAMLVHEFALAAASQGKFWSIEALLLADPKPKNREELKILASQAGIDQNRLWAEVDAHKYTFLISNDLVEAKRIGISGHRLS